MQAWRMDRKAAVLGEKLDAFLLLKPSIALLARPRPRSKTLGM